MYLTLNSLGPDWLAALELIQRQTRQQHQNQTDTAEAYFPHTVSVIYNFISV